MPASAQQNLSILAKAKNGLVYLTSNDWTLIVDKATRVAFKSGDTIVARGKASEGVYLLLSGTAKVEIPMQIAPRIIGPGEICGELSFLDELPASLTVIAQDAVEAYFLDRATLNSLFELFPHLASRFYHSLASNLSRRLRDVLGSSSAGTRAEARGAKGD